MDKNYCNKCYSTLVEGKCLKHDYQNEITAIYGCSDDLVEVCGEIFEEYNLGYEERCYLTFDDGTKIKATYPKEINGEIKRIWAIKVLKEGHLFDKKIECLEETSTSYSDIIYLKKGVKTVKCIKLS